MANKLSYVHLLNMFFWSLNIKKETKQPTPHFILYSESLYYYITVWNAGGGVEKSKAETINISLLLPHPEGNVWRLSYDDGRTS